MVGSLPLIGGLLRWYARRYEDGSVVRIARGYAAGLQWKRYHRYVSGYWLGIYEMHIQQTLSRELKEGDTFYDIGANAGFFSVLAGHLVGAQGCVVAFEPLPENIESIQEQFSLNTLSQCVLIPKAVGSSVGTASLILAHNNSMGKIASAEKPESGKDLKVEITTLDEFIKSHPVPDLVKIDVEGFETEVLAGAGELLNSAGAPKLLIELHGAEKARQVGAILSASGYTLTDLSGKPLVNEASGYPHIMAYPPNAQPEGL
jgi:FkbM family methyltransferase